MGRGLGDAKYTARVRHKHRTHKIYTSPSMQQCHWRELLQKSLASLPAVCDNPIIFWACQVIHLCTYIEWSSILQCSDEKISMERKMQVKYIVALIVLAVPTCLVNTSQVAAYLEGESIQVLFSSLISQWLRKDTAAPSFTALLSLTQSYLTHCHKKHNCLAQRTHGQRLY